MPPLNFSLLALFNKAAGDAFRLEILRALAQDAYGVLELCQIFEYRQSGMSHHLKVLAEAGLVTKRREGNTIFYGRSLPLGDSGLALLQQQLYATVDQVALGVKVQGRVDEVKRDRANLSQAFFQQNADEFKQQQDLIADYGVYGDAVIDLLAKAQLPASALALEVGPGEGECLPELSHRFEQVIALDNAEVMLEHAEAHCEQHDVDNVVFACGDTEFLRDCPPLDCVVMNMVLHHTPSPADIFQDIACGLKTGGILIVTELCRHDQDWARTACGDLWLGFDPQELHHWGELVGLHQSRSHYFALRNGFQIQLQQFVK